MGAEVLHVDRQTDRHDKANSRLSSTVGTRPNKIWLTRADRHDPSTLTLLATSLLSHHFVIPSLSTTNITFTHFLTKPLPVEVFI
jgi:hypothetical protein